MTDWSICRVGYLTAAASITGGLHVPLPYLDPTGSSSLKSVLVLGGSSAVGAAAIQLLRLALPSAMILATSSANHHAHLVSLGATKCFERSAQEDTSAVKAATPSWTLSQPLRASQLSLLRSIPLGRRPTRTSSPDRMSRHPKGSPRLQ